MMKSFLNDSVGLVIIIIFALLAIAGEILQCLLDVILKLMGYVRPIDRLGVAYVKHCMPVILWEHRRKTMRHLIYFRVVGHTTILLLHSYHLINALLRLKHYLPSHPELQEMDTLFNRYFTTWTLYIQMIYAALALACDLTTIYKKEDLLPKWLRKYRFMLFSGLGWTMPWSVLPFWPIYWYRKEFIMKPGFELVVTPACNVDFHAAVHVYALWEMLFLPKHFLTYKSTGAFLHTVSFGILYLASVFYTKFVDPKIWIYNIMNFFDGTVFLYFLFIGVTLQAFIAYFLQGHVKKFLWKNLGFMRKTK